MYKQKAFTLIELLVVIAIIAILMVADASFALLNLTKIESSLHTIFPKMNVKTLAATEGIVGAAILIIKFATQTIQ